MDKFPVLGRTDLDDSQRALWEELTLGPRGFYTGGPDAQRLPELYNAWLQFPQFGQLMLRVADRLREQSELSGRHRELVILTTSMLLHARVEYEFHVPFARNEGLSDAVIAAIGEGASPPFDDPGDAVIHRANVELVRTATLQATTRRAVVELVGYRGLMQVIAAVSLYTVVAYTTNVAAVQLAEDFSADPEQLKAFFASGKDETKP